MKTCSKCKETKPFTEFNKAKRYPGGLRYDCKACQSAYRKMNFQKNKEKQLSQSLEWKHNNVEHCREYAKSYKLENRAYYTQKEMERHSKKVSSSLLKGDEWNDFVIQELYELASERRKETGIG